MFPVLFINKIFGNTFVWFLSKQSLNTEILNTEDHIHTAGMWGKSHWISRNYGLNGAIYYFLKPETNKDEVRLYFELLEKSYRGRHHSEILKTDTKTLISSKWMCPQGPQGCQKKRHCPLNKLMEVWCAKIELKIQKIGKTVGKHDFLMIFFSILTLFRSFLNSGSILAQKLNSFICKRHPWDPWGRVHIDLNKTVSDLAVWYIGNWHILICKT